MGLPRHRRMRRPGEFRRVFREGKRAGDDLLLVTAAHVPSLATVFGLAVGKRVGNAVVRNRLKRRLREVLRRLEVCDDWAAVISARPSAGEASMERLEMSVRRLGGRLGLIKDNGQSAANTGRET